MRAVRILREGTVSDAMHPSFYFAYGSNMNQARLSERLARCNEQLLSRHCATLDDYRLAFDKVSSQHDWVGFANIVPATGGRVEGTLNAMSARALEALDAIELVPHHYHRVEVVVRDTVTGAMVPAFTYVANPGMVRPNLKPTTEYIGHLLAAADLLPGSYLDELRAVQCCT